MTLSHRTIHIEPLAPVKPQMGQACNGCGVCCLAQPCPLGMVLSHRRHGACVALRWNPGLAVYRCGAIAQPADILRAALPDALRRLAPALAPALAVIARRAIAMEVGCDSSLETSSAPR